MKGCLVSLGVIALLFLVFLGAGLIYGIYIDNTLSPSGKAYADESDLAIITTWSENELTKRASPEFQAVTTQGQLDQLFVALNKLGKFQSYGGAQGKAGVSFNSRKGIVITATYHASATFQYGKADITITLIRHNDAWQIDGFHLDENRFYP